MGKDIGHYAFLIGVVIAILAGLGTSLAALDASIAGIISLILLVLGLIVGYLNIGQKEVQKFLIVALAIGAWGSGMFVPIGSFIPLIGSLVDAVIINISAFVAPAAIVVALKAFYDLGSTTAA